MSSSRSLAGESIGVQSRSAAAVPLITSPDLLQGFFRRIRPYALTQYDELVQGALLSEFSKLPYDHLPQQIPNRILEFEHVYVKGVEQRQQVLTDFLVVRRGFPDISRIFESGIVFLPSAMALYRAYRYAVAFGPAVRVVGAIGLEGILDRQVPDFAMVRQRVVAMPEPIAFTAVLSIEPAGSAAVRSAVGHGSQLYQTAHSTHGAVFLDVACFCPDREAEGAQCGRLHLLATSWMEQVRIALFT